MDREPDRFAAHHLQGRVSTSQFRAVVARACAIPHFGMDETPWARGAFAADLARRLTMCLRRKDQTAVFASNYLNPTAIPHSPCITSMSSVYGMWDAQKENGLTRSPSCRTMFKELSPVTQLAPSDSQVCEQ